MTCRCVPGDMSVELGVNGRIEALRAASTVGWRPLVICSSVLRNEPEPSATAELDGLLTRLSSSVGRTPNPLP